MDAIIPILDRAPGGARQGVDARDLHAFLGVGRDFSNWIKDRIAAYEFLDGVDYEKVNGSASPNPASANRTDYVLSLDMAKELAMVERTERGKQARAYFLECERRAHSPVVALNDPTVLRPLLLDYAERLLAEQARTAELAPKADAWDRVMASGDTVGFREAAKLLRPSTGCTEQQLRDLIVGRGWVQRLGGRLLPTYVGTERGYVTTRLKDWTDQAGVSHNSPELRFTPKGLERALALLSPELA